MDFYVILGLEPGASINDVKRAYRRLARRCHPGINPGDGAAGALFERISEAYQTLADPERRQQYDAAGGAAAGRDAGHAFEFAGFDFSVAARGPEAATFSELFAEVLHPAASGHPGVPETGADLYASVRVDFEESLRGVERQIVVTRQVICAGCAGAGETGTAGGQCTRCQATGKVRWARGHMVFWKSCPACHGSGHRRSERCPVCMGHGRGVHADAVAVAVPAGVIDGTRLRVAGHGHVGRLGGRTGDLYVDVSVQPHHRWRRDGDDVCMTVPVAVHEAVLGARIDVPSFDGPARLRLPAGTQAGQRFRLAGRGAPTGSGARGDLVIDVQLVLPRTVDDRSRELMREFGRLNGDDVRRDLSS